MRHIISPATNKPYGLKRVCSIWGVPRATIYRRLKTPSKPVNKRGPKPVLETEQVLGHVRADLESSPFRGEGHRKVHARLRRAGVRVGRNRVLNIMRENQLLSPHRSPYRPPNPHDGRITTDAPNEMWGSDGTKIQTVEDGWVWVFSVVEHWNGECMGWHVCKTGDRFAALEPVAQAVRRALRVAHLPEGRPRLRPAPHRESRHGLARPGGGMDAEPRLAHTQVMAPALGI